MGVQNGGRGLKKEEKYLGAMTQDTLTQKRNINVLFVLTYGTLTDIKVALITLMRWT